MLKIGSRAWGSGGREFKSRRPDQKKYQNSPLISTFFLFSIQSSLFICVKSLTMTLVRCDPLLRLAQIIDPQGFLPVTTIRSNIEYQIKGLETVLPSILNTSCFPSF